MYESEVNNQTETLRVIPGDVVAQLCEYRGRVHARTVLPWGEHCTECVWPSCYTSCELYEPRVDGACRQFVGGVTRVPTPEATVPYLQKITFRRWAKLWTAATTQCRPLDTADRWEQINILAGAAAQRLPAPRAIKQRALAKLSYVRRQKLSARSHSETTPDCFVIEIYNPGQKAALLTLTMRPNVTTSGRLFQRLISAAPGLIREKIAFADLAATVADAEEGFQIELVPNEAENLTLYFGLLDFVQEKPQPVVQLSVLDEARKCKCVVWDLDNTLWSGVLIEDGLPAIRLRDGVGEIILELDRRGILQSVASKNDADYALAALRHFGLEEYFLHPQIGWLPKSRGIASIAKALNIGLDTLVFVDDQEFERQEVATALPEVRVVDASAVPSMLASRAFRVPITEESRMRRQMYRQEERRGVLEASLEGDYIGFLKANQMQMRLSALSEANLGRVYELAQRTNQMNFSGNRYPLEELRRISADAGLETYVMRCSDRFGTYGIVGFAVVSRAEPRLVDLMFSCRVQSKRVEHEFLAWLILEHRKRQDRDFLANFRKTPRNAPSGAVFRELGFEEVGEESGVTSLRFGRHSKIERESIVEIDVEER